MQDLRALAAILVAWQVGEDTYMEMMKKISNRLNFIKQYVLDIRNNIYVRLIAKGTLLEGEGFLTIAQIKEIYCQYLKKVAPLELETP